MRGYSRLYLTDYDWTYVIILLILFVVSLIVQNAVNSKYTKYSKVKTFSGITGAEAARRVLEAQGITDVRILPGSGADLSDYYDPKTNSIYLSDKTYNGAHVAAVGVACHEAGHAMQAASDYGPYKLRRAMIPVANIGSRLAIPLIIVGLILSASAWFFRYIAIAGIALFAVAVFLQLVTLPVELNASSRALQNITACGILNQQELKGAKSVLTAAAMTYVVATLTALVQLLRFVRLLRRR